MVEKLSFLSYGITGSNQKIIICLWAIAVSPYCYKYYDVQFGGISSWQYPYFFKRLCAQSFEDQERYFSQNEHTVESSASFLPFNDGVKSSARIHCSSRS